MEVDIEHLEVVQRHNRAVRGVIRQLRRRLSRIQNETDEKIALLFESSSQAEIALEEIRTLGGIDCDPDNYGKIVAVCLTALGKEQPTPIGQ
jgi:hypothetical protein